MKYYNFEMTIRTRVRVRASGPKEAERLIREELNPGLMMMDATDPKSGESITVFVDGSDAITHLKNKAP